MAERSKIKKLAPDVRARIDAWLAVRDRSVDEFFAFLKDDLNLEIGRTAAYEYQTEFDKVARKLRQSREITEALAKEIGDAAGQGKQGRLLVEMVRSLVFDLLIKLQDTDDGKAEAVDPKDIANLAKGLADLGRALRLDQDFEAKVREGMAKEAVAKLDKAVAMAAAEAGEKGLTPERVAQLRRDFLGVRDGA